MKKKSKVSKWVSVTEMGTIKADTQLVSRLKAGSRAAKKKNGCITPTIRKGWAKAFKKAVVEGLKAVEKGKTMSVADAKMKLGLK